MNTPASPVTVAWINNSYESPGSETMLSASDAAKIVEALNIQNQDLVTAWGPQMRAAHVVATDPGSAPEQAILAYFLFNADVAGTLGYHYTDPSGNPYIRVFVETILGHDGTVLAGSNSVSVCAGHEADEEAVDPGCSSTATAANGDVWALEVGDPVESSSYAITLADGSQVAVSNFVFPSFFDPQGQPPYDQLGVISSPFTIASGGYAIINSQQVFAARLGGTTTDRAAAGYPEWRWQMKVFERSRTARRLPQILGPRAAS